MSCWFCDNEHSYIVLETGWWISLVRGVTEDGRICIHADAEDSTDNYYPKFCPECGRKLPSAIDEEPKHGETCATCMFAKPSYPGFYCKRHNEQMIGDCFCMGYVEAWPEE